MNKKTILVTGGLGFIGANLCKYLLENGHHVICLDNHSTSRIEKVVPLQKYSEFQFIAHDIVEPFDMKVDEIYNLACPASPIQYQKDAVKTIMTCILGAKNMLDLATKYSAKILQSSTSEVYGNTTPPQKETDWGNVNPIGPRSCYDEGKRCAESLFFNYNKQYNTDVRVVRIFNTYGPGMSKDDGRIISNFITQALNNEDITIYGDGLQTRSYCYVDDTVRGLVDVMNQEYIGPINIGNARECYNVLEVARLVQDLISETKSKLIFKPIPKDDPYQRMPYLDLTRKHIEWDPDKLTTLENGLKKTIEYFKNI